MHNNHCHRVTAYLQLNIIIIIIIIIKSPELSSVLQKFVLRFVSLQLQNSHATVAILRY